MKNKALILGLLSLVSPILGCEQLWSRPQVRFIYNTNKEKDAICFINAISSNAKIINEWAKLGIDFVPPVNRVYFLEGKNFSSEEIFKVISKKSDLK